MGELVPHRMILNFIGVVVLATSAVAQTSPTRQTAKPKPAPPPASATPIVTYPTGILAPLSPDVERLPTNYPGDSIEGVIRLLRVAPKSEFETAEQYNARLNANRSTRTYSFWLDRPMDRFYDAEKQTLRLSLADTNCSYIGVGVDCRLPPLVVKQTETNRRTYSVTNRLGATWQVLRIERANFAIFLANPPLQFIFELPLAIAEAKLLKDTISILVTVGSVAQGQQLVFEGGTASLATFDVPYETIDSYTYVALPLIRTWIASRTTGQIFQKLDVGF